MRPEADGVHVSVAFTWDVPQAERLVQAWGQYYPVVKLGGPALNSPVDGFTPGQYVKSGVTFTSRGCDGRCPWCLVPEREGCLVELDPIVPGYIIQDNNLLACSAEHRWRVYRMLANQPRAAVFAGGIQPSRVTYEIAEELRGVRIDSLFLAADTLPSLGILRRAVDRLSFLGRKKLRCYMLLGFGNDTLADAAQRLQIAWEIGVMPFAQMYQPPNGRIAYSPAWRALAKAWSRPAAMMAMHTERG